MSLNSKHKLIEIAKIVARDLRRNSTQAENIFWEAVRNRRFCNKKFYRQFPIYIDFAGKESFFVADFYCHEERLVIELDGLIHQYRLKEDQDRTEIIKYLGIKVLRFTNEEVINDLSKVLEEIKSYFSK
uniref:Endonuclease domain-containing protein n=1 Tax=Ignavibacterium album TaxID=591197 RepID=A0A832G6V9_9BACT